MSKLYLFTTSACIKCPAAKEMIKKFNIDCEILEADTNDKALELAKKYFVSSVPSFIEVFDDGTYTIHTSSVIEHQRERFQKK